MDSKTKRMQQIAQQEENKFIDEGFGQLDLSGFPGLQKLPSEEFAEQDKHGLSRVDTSGMSVTNKLKELLANPDQAALAELSKQDPELAADLAEDRATEIARQFVAENPKYLRTDRNFERIVDFLLRKHFKQSLRNYPDADEASLALLAAGVWTVPELTATFNKLYRDGELETASNEPRYLTEAEKIRVQQIAGNGDILEAIVEYVKGRVGQDVADQVAFNLIDSAAFVSDPANRPIFEEAAWFCWQAARHDFSPTPERIALMKKHIAGRFISIALLDAAWAAAQEAAKANNRSALLNSLNENPENGQPEQIDLENLSDEEIARLKTATLREYAKQQRRK